MTARAGTAAFAIAYVHYLTDGKVTLNVNLIRVWANRKHIDRVGTDLDGFALYNLDQIVSRAVVAQQTTDV